MDRARVKLGDKVMIPAVVEKIEYTTEGGVSYKVKPIITTWFDAGEIEALIESLPPVALKPVTDCISRQQVTDEIKRWRGDLDEDMIERINTRMNMLPPVTPKERTGEWGHIVSWTYKGKCTNCGFIHAFIDGHDTQYKYCPNCGAKMTKGGDE